MKNCDKIQEGEGRVDIVPLYFFWLVGVMSNLNGEKKGFKLWPLSFLGHKSEKLSFPIFFIPQSINIACIKIVSFFNYLE